MANFNKAILIGNLCRDPELRHTSSGTAICTTRLAVNRTWGTGESRKQETLFIDLTFWGKSAETVNRFVQKGDPILVEGRLMLEQWESEGQKRSKISLTVENFQFMRSRGETGETGETSTYPDPYGGDDEVPF